MSVSKKRTPVLDRSALGETSNKSPVQKQRRHSVKRPKPTTAKPVPPEAGDESSPAIRIGLTFGLVTAVLSATLIWSYWIPINSIVEAWNREPDYSHGFFVLPISVWFLWIRRDKFPANAAPAISGLLLVATSVGVRFFGTVGFIDAVVGWSMLFWVGGVVATLFGWQVFKWSLPSILFLWFMIPLPFRLETAMRQPLQMIATQVSSVSLQVLGQPAIPEGNTIRIGDYQYGVDEACSGLRIFVGIAALAFAYVIISRRSWWIRGFMLLAILPITLVANSTRIVVTCLLYQAVSSEAAKTFSHDLAGFVMIPFAALLFGLFAWYLKMLIREVPTMSFGDLLRSD